jgi:AcrR family transcriptional regulator
MKALSRRQQQIADAALEIISTQGIQNLTIKTLSEKIGVTEGAIYRHYTGKAEILGAIADFFKDSSTEILNKLLASDASGLQQLKIFFLGRIKQFYDSPGLTMVMFSENIFKAAPVVEKRSRETIHSHQELLVKSIKQGQQNGEIVANIAPPHLFMIVIGALRLLVTRWRGAKYSFNLEEEGRKLWDSIETLISV